MTEHGGWKAPEEPENENRRREQLRDLLVTQAVFRDIGIEQHEEVTLMTDAENALYDVVAANIKALNFDANSLHAMQATVNQDVGEQFQSRHYRRALNTVINISEHDKSIQGLELSDITATIESRMLEAEARENPLKKARRHKIPKAKTVFKHPVALLTAASLVGVWGGYGVGAVAAANQEGLPVYATSSGRELLVSELENAAIALEKIPAGKKNVTDAQGNVTTIPVPVRFPNSYTASQDLSRIQAQLSGTGPIIEGRIVNIQGELFNPPVSTQTAFAPIRREIREVEKSIPDFAHSNAAQTYATDSAIIKGGVAGGLGGLGGLVVAGALGYFRMRRTKHR